MATATDRDYERVFVRDSQRQVMHFYCIGNDGNVPNHKRFSYGYMTPDGVYHFGTIAYDAREGEFVNRMGHQSVYMPDSEASPD